MKYDEHDIQRAYRDGEPAYRFDRTGDWYPLSGMWNEGDRSRIRALYQWYADQEGEQE